MTGNYFECLAQDLAPREGQRPRCPYGGESGSGDAAPPGGLCVGRALEFCPSVGRVMRGTNFCLKATLSAPRLKGDWKLLVKISSQSSSSFTSCHFCKFLVAKLKGGALRRLEPSGAAGWVAVVLHGKPGMRHGVRCA